MSKPKTAIPTTGDLNLFCQRLLTINHPEDVLALIAALDESVAEIEAQRTMRQRDGSASPGWLQASAGALKYCGLKVKACREHYDSLISGRAPEEFSPVETWLVTFCNNAAGDLVTRLSHKHPAEFLLDLMESAPAGERENFVLFNSIKVHPSQTARASKIFKSIPES